MLLERFEVKYVPEPNSGCWLWTAGLNKWGYGQFWDGGKLVGAHCYAYTALKGPIPSGLQLDHTCRTRCCVNPEHLEPVTIRENVLRGDGITARNARQQVCKYGHSQADAYIMKSGRNKGTRICKTCARIKYIRRKV